MAAKQPQGKGAREAVGNAGGAVKGEAEAEAEAGGKDGGKGDSTTVHSDGEARKVKQEAMPVDESNAAPGSRGQGEEDAKTMLDTTGEIGKALGRGQTEAEAVKVKVEGMMEEEAGAEGAMREEVPRHCKQRSAEGNRCVMVGPGTGLGKKRHGRKDYCKQEAKCKRLMGAWCMVPLVPTLQAHHCTTAPCTPVSCTPTSALPASLPLSPILHRPREELPVSLPATSVCPEPIVSMPHCTLHAS